MGETDGSSLRVHAFLPISHTNGPGARAAIWVQGCSLGCPGCFNPETHSPAGGQSVDIEALLARIMALRDGIEGVSITGGEPLGQRGALAELLSRLKARTDLSVVLFTGFSWAEVTALDGSAGVLANVDLVVAGRYVVARRLARDLRGSDNQTLHFLSDRYGADDLRAVPMAEVLVGLGGEIVVSGVGPPRLDGLGESWALSGWGESNEVRRRA